MATISKKVTLEDSVDINVDEDDFDLSDLIEMLDNKLSYSSAYGLESQLSSLIETIRRESNLGDEEPEYLDDKMKREWFQSIKDKYTSAQLEKMIPA